MNWKRGDSLTVRLSRAGYAPWNTSLMTPNANYLHPSERAQPLAATEYRADAPVEVLDPRLVSIAGREQQYKGYFVGPDMLEKMQERPLLDALRTFIPTLRLDYLAAATWRRAGAGPRASPGRGTRSTPRSSCTSTGCNSSCRTSTRCGLRNTWRSGSTRRTPCRRNTGGRREWSSAALDPIDRFGTRSVAIAFRIRTTH